MGIDVRHEIDPALVGALTYLAGRQQYRQRQNESERALWEQNQKNLLDQSRQRDAEIARERAIRDRPEQVTGSRPARRLLFNPFEESQLADTALRADASILQKRDEIYGGLINRVLQGQQNREGLAAELYNNQLNRQQESNQDLLAWGAESAEALEAQIKDVQSMMAKSQDKLTPEGRRKYAELAGKLRAIQKNRGFSPPAEYARHLGQWLEEYQSSGVEDHIIEPPSIEEYVVQNGWDNGKGYTFVRQPDGKIQAFKTAEPQPTKEEIDLKKEERQFAREKNLLDINIKRVDAYSKWLSAMPEMPDQSQFLRVVPGAVGKDGERSPSTSEVDEGAWNRALQMHEQAMAYWQQRDPSKFGFGEEPDLPLALKGQPAPGDPLPASQPQTPGMQGQVPPLGVQGGPAPGPPLPANQPQTPGLQQPSTEPVAVVSGEDLRSKIQSGLIPIGGKYVVNGVVFTRTR